MPQNTLKGRSLPPLKTKEEMLSLLTEEEYGIPLPPPEEISFETEGKPVRFSCGKYNLITVRATARIMGKSFSFPFRALLPAEGSGHPFFAFINFDPHVPSRYCPAEEVTDQGYAVLALDYQDITSDDGDFQNGLAGLLYPDGKRAPTDPGKIALWAWGVQRLMDYAESLGGLLDPSRGMVCGHSRLGKTALFAAATDERFAGAYSNDSGCSGAAISRGKEGETVEKIYNRFPYWFCERFEAWKAKEEEMPFDQHYLLAAIAPRPVFVGSATEDQWADPQSEFLSCLAAAPAWEAFGLAGMKAPEKFPEAGDAFLEGNPGYHLRAGCHYFSRHDWLRLCEFRKKKNL